MGLKERLALTSSWWTIFFNFLLFLVLSATILFIAGLSLLTQLADDPSFVSFLHVSVLFGLWIICVSMGLLFKLARVNATIAKIMPLLTEEMCFTSHQRLCMQNDFDNLQLGLTINGALTARPPHFSPARS